MKEFEVLTVCKAEILPAKDGRPKAAEILVSVTGDTLPDGSDDLDRQNEVTDYETFKAVIPLHDGTVVWHHSEHPAARLAGPGVDGGECEWIANDAKREVFAKVRTENPIVVNLVESRIPLASSWRGRVVRRWQMAKRGDGQRVPAKRIFPYTLQELTLTLADGLGAIRSRSRALAQAVKADGAPYEEDIVEDLMKMVAEAFGASAPEVQTAFVVALFGMLPEDQKAAALAEIGPKKEEAAPPEPPAPGDEAKKAAEAKPPEPPAAPAPASVSVTVVDEEKEALKASVAGLTAAVAEQGKRFDETLALLRSHGERIEQIAKTPQTVVAPMTNDEAAKAAGIEAPKPKPDGELRPKPNNTIVT